MRMFHNLVLALAAVFAIDTTILSSPSLAQSKTVEQSLSVQGQTRTYRLFVPERTSKNQANGLIFDFHGGGGNGKHEEESHAMDQVANKYNFIAVYPDGLSKRWNDGRPGCSDDSQDIEFVKSLIDTLENKYKIQHRHVFVCGISNGAIFSNHLALKLSDRIGAIASIAGAISDSDRALKPSSPVSALIIHGTDDSFVPFEGGEIQGAFAIGGKVCSHAETYKRWQDNNGGAASTANSLMIASNGIAMKGRRPLKLATPIKITTIKTKSGATCTSIVVENGGHTWPGHIDQKLFGIDGVTAINIDATEAIGKFFTKAALDLSSGQIK